MEFLKQFHFQLKGDPQKPKLVFLHGVMGYWANWRRIVTDFEGEYEVLVYDQRGHGRSFKPDSGYSPEDYAQDLKKILDELGWKEIFLVGHSMGGRNAMAFATHYPDYVKKLVIEDIGPDANVRAVDRLMGMLARIPTPFSAKKEAKEFFLNQFGDPMVGNYLYSNLEEKEDGRWGWRFHEEGIKESIREGRAKDRWDQFKDLKMPVLVIRGSESEDLPEEVFEEMKKQKPKAEFVTIPGAGHWVHFQKPEEFVAALKKFF